MRKLLNRKTKVYRRKFTEQEIYEQERFYQLRVEDQIGIINKIGGEDAVDEMFSRLQCSRLSDFITENISSKRNNVIVKVSDGGEVVVASVTITKRHYFQEFKGFLYVMLNKYF
jgi:hypothetical protein